DRETGRKSGGSFDVLRHFVSFGSLRMTALANASYTLALCSEESYFAAATKSDA
ncbi:MAG: hypothetical protein QOC81_4944, partial [Thermoanaerobaculia bacterium]|nr:hypothetical protein [Thermoanaerobaculia bacterium]